MIFSNMRGRKNFFDEKIKFLIKFRFEWYMMMWGSYYNCECFQCLKKLRRREKLLFIKNTGNCNMNPTSSYIIWSGILWRILFFHQIFFPPTHIRENQVLKNLRGREPKILSNLKRKLNFMTKYMYMLIFHVSVSLESIMP